jgi:hypothetical protein
MMGASLSRLGKYRRIGLDRPDDSFKASLLGTPRDEAILLVKQEHGIMPKSV